MTTLQFIPRPDAHASQWDDLLSPIQKAIRDLLTRILGAVGNTRSTPDGNQHNLEDNISNCFLVYGDRGTGKSTVLLNAAKAIRLGRDGNDFFPPHPQTPTSPPQTTREVASSSDEFAEQKKAEYLASTREYAGQLHDRGLIWLDVLDLEPLPAKSNLLTILLTRVRGALDQPGLRGSHMATTSRFEEGVEGARQKLTRLITDGALMWGDITETDTRIKANRQVAAADIYASFRGKFLNAMDALSEELDIHSGRGDGFRAIVLPIDNIDRSTEHLYGIIKLAQMVSCHHLFLVMAGERVDVEAFLERAYWKELISVGQAAGASGKTGVDGEDEAFVMARRQSTAAAQKFLPQSHRVEVQRVRAEETLGFYPRHGHGLGSDQGKRNNTIKELFGKLVLHSRHIRVIEVKEDKDKVGAKTEKEMKEAEEKKKKKEAEIEKQKLTLLHLFDTEQLLVHKPKAKWFTSDEDENEGDTSTLSFAADYGLRLPARGVLDLWQLVYWEIEGLRSSHQLNQKRRDVGSQHQKRYEMEGDVKALKIARTMARNIIAESGMSSRLSHLLQDRVILRNAKRGTVLDFNDVEPETRIKRLTKSDQKYRFLPISLKVCKQGGTDDEQYTVRTTLKLNKIEGLFLYIQDRQAAGASPGKKKGDYDIELPAEVTAWLTVLHDTARWAIDSSVIGFGDIPTAPRVEVIHEVSRSDQLKIHTLKLRWPAPDWGSFVAHNIFHFRWKKFIRRVKKCNTDNGKEAKKNLRGLNGDQAMPRLKDTQSKLMEIRPRLLLYGWIACALETFFSLSVETRFVVLGQDNPDLTERITNLGNANEIEAAEARLMRIVAKLYGCIESLGLQQEFGSIILPNRQSAYMRDWLEEKLPLLLSPLYMPMAAQEDAKIYCERMASYLRPDGSTKNQGLLKHWSENANFILSQANADLANMFDQPESPKNGKNKKKNKKRNKSKRPIPIENPESLQHFGELHRFLRQIEQTGG